MNSPLPEQIEKLPKWAQRHIATLSSKVEQQGRELDGLKEDLPDSPAKFYPDGVLGDGYGVSTRANMEWRHGRDRINVRYRSQSTDDDLIVEVMTMGTLQIEPRASNHIRIRVPKE